MTNVIAVDPGLHGAIAVLTPGHLSVYDMPVRSVYQGRTYKDRIDLATLLLILQTLPTPTRCLVEDARALPGWGVERVFQFGKCVGIAECALAMQGWDPKSIAPVKWKQDMGLPGGKDNKHHARTMAAKLFPARADLFRREKDDGRAEAALLAWYGSQL